MTRDGRNQIYINICTSDGFSLERGSQWAALLAASVISYVLLMMPGPRLPRPTPFYPNVICLFLPAGWAKRRQSLGKGLVRGSTTLFACCVDKLIDQPGVEDHKFLFAPILTVDSQANEKPTFWAELFQRRGRNIGGTRVHQNVGVLSEICRQILFVVGRIDIGLRFFLRFSKLGAASQGQEKCGQVPGQ